MLANIGKRFEWALVRKALYESIDSIHHLPVVPGELPLLRITAQVPLLCGDPEASGDTGQGAAHRKVLGSSSHFTTCRDRC